MLTTNSASSGSAAAGLYQATLTYTSSDAQHLSTSATIERFVVLGLVQLAAISRFVRARLVGAFGGSLRCFGTGHDALLRVYRGESGCA